METRDAVHAFVTGLPSYLQQIPDAAANEQEYARFVAWLAEAGALAGRCLAA